MKDMIENTRTAAEAPIASCGIPVPIQYSVKVVIVGLAFRSTYRQVHAYQIFKQ